MQECDIRDFFFESLLVYGFKRGKKELSIDGLRIDVFAVDKNNIPYIIEFKKDKNRHIVGQAAQYLALIPTFKEQIEKELNFSEIKWSKLTILCIAPDFLSRDINAAEYNPLKGKVHFYKFSISKNSRNQIFALNLKYKGPNKKGPLILPKPPKDTINIKKTLERFSKIGKKEARREYYSTAILPLLKKIGNKLPEFNKLDLFPHASYWNTWFVLRFGTDKAHAHRASIELAFHTGENADKISFRIGFDLTHSIDEGKYLSKIFQQQQKERDCFIKNTLKLKDYYLCIPNTGIREWISIEKMNKKGLRMLLNAYNPAVKKDCYFRIGKYYEYDELDIGDAVAILKNEYKKFKYIFKLLKKPGA